MNSMNERITFDSVSARRVDENGFLHVEKCHITKEQVVPYYGREIPGWHDMGLDPEKIYQVYRPAAELEKSYQTFNGLPLQLEHHPDSAENPQTIHRVGSLGTDAEWNPPYIDITLSVTDQRAIDAIQDGRFKELSASYQYEPVLRKGEFDGKPYDIIMTNIRGNHVALVREGRAGPDVVVADSNTVKRRRKSVNTVKELNSWLESRRSMIDQITPFTWHVAKDSVSDSKEFDAWYRLKSQILPPSLSESFNLWYNKLASDAEGDEPEDWITIRGNHIPVREGETKKEAAQRFLTDKLAEKKRGFKPYKNPLTVSGKSIGSPTDKVISKFKSFDELKTHMADINGKMKFGEASDGDRTLKSYPALQKAYEQAASNGPAFAKDYEEISRAIGGEMYGKEFGIKGAGSLERKIRDNVAKAKEKGESLTPEQALSKMTDVVRFTTLANDQEVPKVTKNLIDQMQKRGYEVVEVDNKWNDDYAYKGVHVLFQKDGVTFESQIHSPNGMIIKNKLHPLYEIERDESKPKAERDEAHAKQVEIAKGYERPKGIESIKSWKKSKDGGVYNG